MQTASCWGKFPLAARCCAALAALPGGAIWGETCFFFKIKGMEMFPISGWEPLLQFFSLTCQRKCLQDISIKMILEQESLFSLVVVTRLKFRWLMNSLIKVQDWSRSVLSRSSAVVVVVDYWKRLQQEDYFWNCINNIMLGRRVEVSITKCVSYGHTAARSCVHRCELLTLPRLTAQGSHLRTDDLERNI